MYETVASTDRSPKPKEAGSHYGPASVVLRNDYLSVASLVVACFEKQATTKNSTIPFVSLAKLYDSSPEQISSTSFVIGLISGGQSRSARLSQSCGCSRIISDL